MTSFEAIATSIDAPTPQVAPCPSAPGDPAVILYTSGTTSDPKGVVLTHGNLLAEREGALSIVSVSEHDCVLGVLPLFHALAQMANLLLPFSVGARVVFLESVNTSELLRGAGRAGRHDLRLRAAVLLPDSPARDAGGDARGGPEAAGIPRPARRKRRRCDAVGVNAGRVFFSRVHRVLGGSMRILVTGGSRFDPAIGADLFRLGFNILQAYGLTETSGAATIVRPGDSHLGSVGQVLPNAEITSACRPRGGRRGAGRRGAGPRADRHGGLLQPAGCDRRSDPRRLVLHRRSRPASTAEGRLTITGRKKEIIVLSNGKNIYPEEIEAHYRQSPFIKELCVLGLTRPGEPSAERLYAVVVPDTDALREKKVVNTGDLIRFEMEGRSVGLAPPKRVLGYEVWMEPLPRTSTGKAEAVRDRAPRAARRRNARAGLRRRRSATAIASGPRFPTSLPIVAVDPARGARRRDREARRQPGARSRPRLDGAHRAACPSWNSGSGRACPSTRAQRIFTVRELVDAIRVARVGGGRRGERRARGATILASDPPESPDLTSLLASASASPPCCCSWRSRSAGGLSRLVMRLEVSGREHLPARGPYLISPNHQSYIDSFLVAGALPFQRVPAAVLRRRERVLRDATDGTARAVRARNPSRSGLEPRAGDAGRRLRPAARQGARPVPRGRTLDRRHRQAVQEGRGHPLAPPRGTDRPRGARRPVSVLAAQSADQLARLRPWRRPRVAVRFGAPLPAPVLAVTGPSVGPDARPNPRTPSPPRACARRSMRCGNRFTPTPRPNCRYPRWKQLALLHTA